MALTSYELSSWHPDPEGHLEPFDPDPTYCMPNSPSYDPDYDPSPRINIRPKHSVNMPEHVARILHSLQVQQGLDDYYMGITPEENYEIYRQDDDYELPF